VQSSQKSAQHVASDISPSSRVAPRNNVERAICEEFANVLGVEVGITDNFFDLGGHSLMATRVVSRINRREKTRATVRDIFECPVDNSPYRYGEPVTRCAPFSSVEIMGADSTLKLEQYPNEC
jgi:Phosphopantetheine attachment site.